MTSSIIKIALMFFLSNRTCRTGLSRFGKLTFPKSAETKLLLTIDNSIAERAVRPYTVFRNGTMFHGNERGVENTMFFCSLIETGKARGLNVKNYLVSMIREMLHGNTDYKGILQGAYI